MQISIIYDSKTGNTAKAAQYIIEGIEKVEGIYGKAFHIDNIDDIRGIID